MGDGHVITATQLWQRLSETGYDVATCQARVKALLANVFTATASGLVKARHYSNQNTITEFSLMGVDVMFDAGQRPWLLEINYSPDMTVHADIQISVKCAVIQSVYEKVFGPIKGDSVQFDVDFLPWVPLLNCSDDHNHDDREIALVSRLIRLT